MAKRKPRLQRRDPFAEFFDSWRLWLLGALVGALLAWAFYLVFPPDYRSRATVVVDHNLEEAWQYYPDRALFQFLQRETERLEQLAWSDAVIEEVADATNISVQELRSGVLKLAHPSDGGWHFYAANDDPQVAEELASTWATAFVNAARAAISVSPELQAARAALDEELSVAEPDQTRLDALLEEISVLAERTQGISMYVEISVSQSANLPTERRVSLATYLLVASVAGALAAATYVVVRPR